MDAGKVIDVVIIGGSISGNKGAEAMVQSVVENLPDYIGPCSFDLLSIFPKADNLENWNRQIKIIPCRPFQQIFPVLPLAILVAIFKKFNLSVNGLSVTPAFRSLLKADIIIDVSGISFVDGRGIGILVYNFLLVLNPLLLGKPVVKCSQAIGPFRQPLNRLLANIVLKRLSLVCARGSITEFHLKNLGSYNVKPAADLAFSMKNQTKVSNKIKVKFLKEWAEGELIGISPSAVVKEKCIKIGINYSEVVARSIDNIFENSRNYVIIFPHSAQRSNKPGRINDVTVCEDIYKFIKNRDRCIIIREIYSAGELRSIISLCKVLITSRFHAMISALSVKVPVVVIGWSHKYDEVMMPFDLKEWVVPYEVLSFEKLNSILYEILDSEQFVRNKINYVLPSVIESSLKNFTYIRALCNEKINLRYKK